MFASQIFWKRKAKSSLYRVLETKVLRKNYSEEMYKRSITFMSLAVSREG